MKRLIFVTTLALLWASYLVSMEQSTPLEEQIKKIFAKTVATILEKEKELYFTAPIISPYPRSDKDVSSYTPSADPEWVLVVVD